MKCGLHGTARDLGLIFAVGGIGAVVAAVYIALRGIPRRSITWMLLAWAVATLAMIPIGFTTAPWQLMTISLVIFAGLTTGNLIWFTLMGMLVPNDMLGRVSSLDLMVSFSLTRITNALTGPVAALVGVRNTVLGAGLLGGFVGLIALLLPRVRDQEKVPVPAPTTA